MNDSGASIVFSSSNATLLTVPTIPIRVTLSDFRAITSSATGATPASGPLYNPYNLNKPRILMILAARVQVVSVIVRVPMEFLAVCCHFNNCWKGSN